MFFSDFGHSSCDYDLRCGNSTSVQTTPVGSDQPQNGNCCDVASDVTLFMVADKRYTHKTQNYSVVLQTTTYLLFLGQNASLEVSRGGFGGLWSYPPVNLCVAGSSKIHRGAFALVPRPVDRETRGHYGPCHSQRYRARPDGAARSAGRVHALVMRPAPICSALMPVRSGWTQHASNPAPSLALPGHASWIMIFSCLRERFFGPLMRTTTMAVTAIMIV
jgi:hypothetical protein